jgi:hypothetical protein
MPDGMSSCLGRRARLDWSGGRARQRFTWLAPAWGHLVASNSGFMCADAPMSVWHSSLCHCRV